MLMHNPDAAVAILQDIHATGVQLAIDDFGMGYSSVSYLESFPIHCLKIDRAFIRDLPDDCRDIAITRAIITLAQSLDMKVVAEGVETRAQQNMLMQEGCDEFQGFLFSKPTWSRK